MASVVARPLAPLLLLAFIATTSGFATSLQQFMHASRHDVVARPLVHASRPAVAAVRLEEAADDAEPAEAELTEDEPAAKEEPAKEEEEEEEEDLLSTPAFLKQVCACY